MKWIKVAIKEYTNLFFPDECPNCLSKPSAHFVGVIYVIRKRSAISNPIRGVYSIDWPYCKTCFEFFSQRDKTRRKYILFTYVTFLFIISSAFFLMQWLNYPAMLIFAFVFFLIIGFVFYLRYHWLINRIPLMHNAIKRGETVRMLRGGEISSEKKFIEVSFLNPQYAKIFIERNIGNNPKYNEHDLSDSGDTILNRNV